MLSARSVGTKNGHAKSNAPMRDDRIIVLTVKEKRPIVDYAQKPLVGENSYMDRIAMLSELLSQEPNNAFARYGLAMEYSKSGELDRALDEFGKLVSANPDYTAGYFMAAQTLAKAGRAEEAKKMLGSGISSARRKGDAHAESEMQAMLEELKGTA